MLLTDNPRHPSLKFFERLESYLAGDDQALEFVTVTLSGLERFVDQWLGE
jgi:hypothetical protein